jgi:hypothetical protein
LLKDYLERYPQLYVDLSVRDAHIAPDGELKPEWEDLLVEYANRFLIGVDTYRTQRWLEYQKAAQQIRGWLAQLPEEVAVQLAVTNATRLFKIAPDSD